MKKVDFKKTLVRNTVQPIQPSNSNRECSKSEIKKSVPKSVNVDNYKLDKPELQSTLKLTKTIDNFTKHQRTKSLTEGDKLAVDEKVTRKVNFPYDQPIYKDLIPLEVDQCKCSVLIPSRGPLPNKDKEPILSDFLDVKVVPKYYCAPPVKIEQKVNTMTCNNLRLYYITEKHDGLKP